MRKLQHHEIPRPDPGTVADLPRHPVCAVLDDIRSIYNVGSIFRTSDAALVEKLWLTGYTGTPAHRNLHKTALGAQDTVPWAQANTAEDVLYRLRQQGYTVAVLEITDTPTSTRDLQPAHFPLCLVVGNEVDGVRSEIVKQADLALEIPQFGAKHSLNVAVAFGIAVFDVVRRYRTFHPESLPPAPRDQIS
jgi:tRNA G18 (ribose-2'-O)-methylase SpoU